jgi:hypothetical protein
MKYKNPEVRKRQIELMKWKKESLTNKVICQEFVERMKDNLLKREVYEGLWNKGVIVLLGILFAIEQFVNKSWIIGSIWLLITLGWSYIFIKKLNWYRGFK